MTLAQLAKKLGFMPEYPGVELVIGGEVCGWEKQNDGTFRCGDITMRVKYNPIAGGVRKSVEITSPAEQITPDHLVIDRQKLPDPAMKMRGYVASSGVPSVELSDEEGGGVMPGCGYPLIGKKYFYALEHQAGFNTVTAQSDGFSVCELRQHPVWNNGRLETMSAVLVRAADPEQAFRDYLETIRKPRLTAPLFSFCSFWSEKYCGNYEYIISHDNYRSFVAAFEKLGLRPDVYTLDAGWQDRASIFVAKAATGGDAGIVKLRKFLEKSGAKLSLWVSHNGPMGIDPEYLRVIGVAVGGGKSSTYCGDKFGVLLDEKFEAMLTDRFCELVSPPIGAVHFKMDWDNDCAVSPEFKEKYPSRNHVREGSVNAQNRIATAINWCAPGTVIRHGWWDSPWQLRYADHVFLADAGDCEYSSIPSLYQRDCALTARDIQYYHHFRRDGSMLPLDSIDNHDFPQAPRNPFAGDDAVWSNTVAWVLMRGTTYQPWKLQPEALTDVQVELLRDFMQYARDNAEFLFNGSTAMVGGNPRRGEIYGFIHSFNGEKLLAMRNPLPIPQQLPVLPETAGKYVSQIYPCCGAVDGEVTFAPHEVKVFLAGKRRFAANRGEFQYRNGKYYFPASATVSKQISPMVSAIYQMPEFELSNGMDQLIPGGKRYWFKLCAPYRMKNCALYFRLSGQDAAQAEVKLYLARGERAVGNCCCLPLTEVFSGAPGRGERLNPEAEPVRWQRYFKAEVPCGGEAYFRLEFNSRNVDAEVWASGYESCSRCGADKGAKLDKIMQIPAHPFGFPRNSRLVITGSEPELTE